MRSEHAIIESAIIIAIQSRPHCLAPVEIILCIYVRYSGTTSYEMYLHLVQVDRERELFTQRSSIPSQKSKKDPLDEGVPSPRSFLARAHDLAREHRQHSSPRLPGNRHQTSRILKRSRIFEGSRILKERFFVIVGV